MGCLAYGQIFQTHNVTYSISLMFICYSHCMLRPSLGFGASFFENNQISSWFILISSRPTAVTSSAVDTSSLTRRGTIDSHRLSNGCKALSPRNNSLLFTTQLSIGRGVALEHDTWMEPRISIMGCERLAVWSTFCLRMIDLSHRLSLAPRGRTVIDHSQSIHKRGPNPVVPDSGQAQRARPDPEHVITLAASCQLARESD